MSREILNVCREIKSKIDAEKARLFNLRCLVENLSAELDGLPKIKTGNSRVENLVSSIVDSENKIYQLIRIKAECIVELNSYLEKMTVDGAALQILVLRYGFCMQFEEIAARIGYTIRRVFKLHSAGLKKVIQ